MYISSISKENRQLLPLQYLTTHPLKFWKMQTRVKVFSFTVRTPYSHIQHDSFTSIKGSHSYKYFLNTVFMQFFFSLMRNNQFFPLHINFILFLEILQSQLLFLTFFIYTHRNPNLIINARQIFHEHKVRYDMTDRFFLFFLWSKQDNMGSNRNKIIISVTSIFCNCLVTF